MTILAPIWRRKAYVAVAIGLAFALTETSFAASTLVVSDGWIRAMPGNLPAGGYFKLHNATAAPVSLVGASSPACGMLMLHKSDTMSGMAQMKDIDRIDVLPGSELTFAPGGYHLMCMNPKSLRPGGRVHVTLEFADRRKVSADFAVRNAAGH